MIRSYLMRRVLPSLLMLILLLRHAVTGVVAVAGVSVGVTVAAVPVAAVVGGGS